VNSIWLEAGEVIVMLEKTLRGGAPQGGSAHLVAFVVDELDSWEARLTEAGVPVADRTPSTLYVRDPDGHRVGLSCYPSRH